MKICRAYRTRAGRWGFTFYKDELSVSGIISSGESALACAMCILNIPGQYFVREMRVREFASLTKNWSYAGDSANDISNWIKKALRAERKKLKES